MATKDIRRPYDLPIYSQLSSGSTGYIAPSDVYLLVDNPDFGALPKRLALDQVGGAFGGSGLSGRFAPTSRAVNRTFTPAFSVIPAGSVSVYRMFEVEANKWVKQDVQFYYPSAAWITINGFNIRIEDSESLTDVIVEYNFK